MIRLISLCTLPVLLFSGCNTFEQNMEADKEATTTQGMNAKQTQAVEDFSEGGQLNPYEKKIMDQSINAAGSPAGEG